MCEKARNFGRARGDSTAIDGLEIVRKQTPFTIIVNLERPSIQSAFFIA